MSACDTWNVELGILVYENELFSLPAEFHFNNWYFIDGIKCIRGGSCHAIHQYATSKNKCMINYNRDEYKESSYLMYWDGSNLYKWIMSKKVPVDDFK